MKPNLPETSKNMWKQIVVIKICQELNLRTKTRYIKKQQNGEKNKYGLVQYNRENAFNGMALKVVYTAIYFDAKIVKTYTEKDHLSQLNENLNFERAEIYEIMFVFELEFS